MIMMQVKLNQIANNTANVPLKSRVRENRKHGSAGGVVTKKLINLNQIPS
jgi:hypothetical protein